MHRRCGNAPVQESSAATSNSGGCQRQSVSDWNDDRWRRRQSRHWRSVRARAIQAIATTNATGCGDSAAGLGGSDVGISKLGPALRAHATLARQEILDVELVPLGQKSEYPWIAYKVAAVTSLIISCRPSKTSDTLRSDATASTAQRCGTSRSTRLHLFGPASNFIP